MRQVARIVNRGLQRFGLKISKHHSFDPFPVECGDPADRDIVRHVADRQLTMGTYERLYATLMACHHVLDAGISGDFCECGVWRGGNSLIAADVWKRRAVGTRKTYLFDTFSGMTAPTKEDVAHFGANGATTMQTFEENQRADANLWCYAALEDVKTNFRARGLLDENVRFVRGDVMETLSRPESLPESIAVLRLDTDWYESTRKELEVLWPRLAIGGVLIVDDYGWWKGSKKAVDEFFSARRRPFFQYVDYTCRMAVKTSE